MTKQYCWRQQIKETFLLVPCDVNNNKQWWHESPFLHCTQSIHWKKKYFLRIRAFSAYCAMHKESEHVSPSSTHVSTEKTVDLISKCRLLPPPSSSLMVIAQLAHSVAPRRPILQLCPSFSASPKSTHISPFYLLFSLHAVHLFTCH